MDDGTLAKISFAVLFLGLALNYAAATFFESALLLEWSMYLIIAGITFLVFTIIKIYVGG